jgi:hypothetical protein
MASDYESSMLSCFSGQTMTDGLILAIGAWDSMTRPLSRLSAWLREATLTVSVQKPAQALVARTAKLNILFKR